MMCDTSEALVKMEEGRVVILIVVEMVCGRERYLGSVNALI